MVNIPKIHKAMYPHIPKKLIQVSCIPLHIYKNIPFPFKVLSNIPVKPCQGLIYFRIKSNQIRSGMSSTQQVTI